MDCELLTNDELRYVKFQLLMRLTALRRGTLYYHRDKRLSNLFNYYKIPYGEQPSRIITGEFDSLSRLLNNRDPAVAEFILNTIYRHKNPYGLAEEFEEVDRYLQQFNIDVLPSRRMVALPQN